MNKSVLFIVLSIMVNLTTVSIVWSHSVSDKASTSIVSPKDGARLSSPVLVKFDIKNFQIAPAGKNIHKAGHYHLFINIDSPIPLDESIPYDKQHLHFDQGETEVLLSLPVGKHSLQLVVGDEEHEPFEELISKKISLEIIE